MTKDWARNLFHRVAKSYALSKWGCACFVCRRSMEIEVRKGPREMDPPDARPCNPKEEQNDV